MLNVGWSEKSKRHFHNINIRTYIFSSTFLKHTVNIKLNLHYHSSRYLLILRSSSLQNCAREDPPAARLPFLRSSELTCHSMVAVFTLVPTSTSQRRSAGRTVVTFAAFSDAAETFCSFRRLSFSLLSFCDL